MVSDGRGARKERDGTQCAARSTFQRADGRPGTLLDFLFSYLPA